MIIGPLLSHTIGFPVTSLVSDQLQETEKSISGQSNEAPMKLPFSEPPPSSKNFEDFLAFEGG